MHGLAASAILLEKEHLREAVRIRPARRSDLQTILQLVNDEAEKTSGLAVRRVSCEEVESWVDSDLSYVAEFNNKIVGHLGISLWEKLGYGELRSFVVTEQYRNIGIGSFLLSQVIDYAIDNLCIDVIIAFRSRDITIGDGIFRSLGFTEVLFSKLPCQVQREKEKSINKRVYAKRLETILWRSKGKHNNGR
ncbi:GNAT family N-acetyltransferase [Candidatus Marsarchaeota archaeon]|nr:GNAT family N-acetyltransferase [Candidatus Marsarchaeota archaeon]